MSQPRKLQCEFQGKSTGKKTITLGCKLARNDRLTPDAIDELLTNAQLEVELVSDPAGRDDADGQGKLVETEEAKVSGAADCHSVKLGRGEYGFRLSFGRDDIDSEELEKLAYCPGTLKVKRVGEARGKEDANGDGE